MEQIGVPTGAWTLPFRTKVVGGTLREGMLDEIKRLGFNSIRFLFSQDCTWPGYKPETRNGYWNTTYINPQLNGELLTNPTQENPQAVKPTIEIIDQFVAWCEELELRIVFDMHTLAPDDSNVLATNGKWYTTAHPDDAGATAGAKREPRSEAQAIAAHVFLTNRYKNRPIVCGFDIINEPHNCTWDRDPLTGVVGFYERCGKAIHAVNPDVLVICEGVTGNIDHTPVGHEGDVESTTGLYQWSTWWSGKLDGVRNTQVTLNVANKVMYSPHEYGAYLMGVTMQPWFDPEGKVGSNYAGDPFPQNLPEVWRRQWGFLAEENIAPLWIGEFGSYLRIGGDPITGQGSDYNADHLAKDGEWLTYLADYCDTHNISFAYWAYPPGGDPDGLVGQAPAGTAGAAGAKWHTGTDVPAAGTGVDGDFYLRSNGDYYGPKASGAWGVVVASLKGAVGGAGGVDLSTNQIVGGNKLFTGVLSAAVLVQPNSVVPASQAGGTYNISEGAQTVYLRTTGGGALTIKFPNYAAANTEIAVFIDGAASELTWNPGAVGYGTIATKGGPTTSSGVVGTIWRLILDSATNSYYWLCIGHTN